MRIMSISLIPSLVLLSTPIVTYASDTETIFIQNIVANTTVSSKDDVFLMVYDEMALAFDHNIKEMLPSADSIGYIKVTYKYKSSNSKDDLVRTENVPGDGPPKINDKRSYTTCHTDNFGFTYETTLTSKYVYRTDSNGDGKKDSNPGWSYEKLDQAKVQYACNL